MCPCPVSRDMDNYKESGKRKFPDIADRRSGSDFEPKSESLRASTLTARPQIRLNFRPTEEECQGLKPFQEKEFKGWLASLPREILEIGSSCVEELTRKELETKLLSVAKNEPQPPGPPFIGHLSHRAQKRGA